MFYTTICLSESVCYVFLQRARFAGAVALSTQMNKNLTKKLGATLICWLGVAEEAGAEPQSRWCETARSSAGL